MNVWLVANVQWWMLHVAMYAIISWYKHLLVSMERENLFRIFFMLGCFGKPEQYLNIQMGSKNLMYKFAEKKFCRTIIITVHCYNLSFTEFSIAGSWLSWQFLNAFVPIQIFAGSLLFQWEFSEKSTEIWQFFLL